VAEAQPPASAAAAPVPPAPASEPAAPAPAAPLPTIVATPISALTPPEPGLTMAELLEQQSAEEALRAGFNPGEKVKGRVIRIDRETVFLDVKAKGDGIIDRLELEQNGELSVKEGDELEAFFDSYDDGQFVFTVKITARDAHDAELANAAQAQIPIEGKVTAERKGGFEVQMGEHRGFCPFSQIDLFGAQDAALYIGHSFTFLIMEYDGDNLVVSRRRYLDLEREAQRKQLREQLHEGDMVEGVVRKVLEFGAFVDLGGLEGLVPASELSWDRSLRPDQVVKVGDTLKVQIQRLDWEKERISLSLKKAGGDPWLTMAQRYHPTKMYHGKVTRLMPFGAFVALEPGIEGLVHISKLGAGKRLNHANEVLAEGQDLEVYIEAIDQERKRISLVLENPQVGREIEVGGGETFTVGAEVTGRVEEIRPFGIFVKLSPKRTGLLHVSAITFDGMVDRQRSMHKRYPINSELKVVIQNIHENRISLILPENKEDGADEYRSQLVDNQPQKGLGDLGSLFDGIKL
jgi:small subunit ribosomal protein S1